MSDSLQDMGFTTRLEIDSRAMKALLTMDAYVVILGGSDDIRVVQQWMNRVYRDHVDYAIIPCDGHYSRYVQKMLVYAVQWALNVSGANGNYGAGTRSSVRTSATLHEGDTGRIVQLFIAALYFNKYDPGDFGDSFTGAVAAEVRKMQAFERLPITGVGDYSTWSSLLVSNGDPLRPTTGIDTRFWVTPEIASDLKTAGFSAVGRYLANSKVANPLDKKLRPGEVETIVNAGLSLFPIWQMSGTSADHFSASQAILDSEEATSAAIDNGIPRGSIIYFAVDFDAIDEDIDRNILPYFQSLTGRMREKGSPYLVGVYGSRNVCTRVSDEAGAVASFVSGMSTGFSGNLGFVLPRNWAFNQINEANLVLGGQNYYQDGSVVAVDYDVVSGHDLGVRSLSVASDPSVAFLAFAERVWNAAATWAPDVAAPTHLTLAYLRYPTYNSPQWDLTAGGLPPAFAEVADAIAPPIWQYTNLRFGLPIGRQHFAATAGGVYINDAAAKDAAGVADLAGAIGDLLSLISKWLNTGSPMSLKDFVLQQVGGDNTSSFSMEDLIQDVDGYLVGIQAKEAALPSVLSDVLGAPAPKDNFQQFFQERFDGSHATLRAAVVYAAQADDVAFRMMRAGEEGSEQSSGDPLSDNLANELAVGFDEAFSRYL